MFDRYKDTKEQRVTEGKSQESENGLMGGWKLYERATVVGTKDGLSNEIKSY